MDRRLPPVAAGIVGVAWVAVAGTLYRPEGSTLPIGCPFRHATGWDCPGCGSSRALGALARLDPAAALDHNALVPVVAVLVVLSWVAWTRATWTGRPHRALVRGPAAILAIGVILVGFVVACNLGVGSWLGSGLST